MTAIRLLLVMTLLTGAIYPLSVWVVSLGLFPSQAYGSIVSVQGHKVGSALIGQEFKSNTYFWARPSAIQYKPMPSGGSNLSPAYPKLRSQIKAGIPVEMGMASGSGLDPHITVRSAQWQMERIIKARQLSPYQPAQILDLIDKNTQAPDFGIFGERRVNVLALNIALDQIHSLNEASR